MLGLSIYQHRGVSEDNEHTLPASTIYIIYCSIYIFNNVHDSMFFVPFQQFEAFKKHTNSMLQKEKELNEKLRHLAGWNT